MKSLPAPWNAHKERKRTAELLFLKPKKKIADRRSMIDLVQPLAPVYTSSGVARWVLNAYYIHITLLSKYLFRGRGMAHRHRHGNTTLFLIHLVRFLKKSLHSAVTSLALITAWHKIFPNVLQYV